MNMSRPDFKSVRGLAHPKTSRAHLRTQPIAKRLGLRCSSTAFSLELAVALLVQTPITRGGDHGQKGDQDPRWQRRCQATINGKPVEQLREMTVGDGRSGQTLLAHFGLGDATIIDTLRIEWPSGIVQEFHDVAPKQFLTLTEPAQLQTLRTGVLRIQSWKGMAFEMQASSDLKQWSPVTTVTDLTGTLEFTDPDAENPSRRFYRTCFGNWKASPSAPFCLENRKR